MNQSLDLSKYRGIIFDLDGTLINSMGAHDEAWQQTCQEFTIPLDVNWVHQLGGMPSRKVAVEIIRRYGLELDPVLLSQDKIARYERLATQAEVNPQIYQILKDQVGLKKLAIGTGGQRKHALVSIGSSDIAELIDTLVASDDVTEHKPSPDTFLLAAVRLGLAPEHCVVFEDTLIGMQAAYAAGMDCYRVVAGEVAGFYPCDSRVA
jgi:beta-phosphoglucomutase family hydrolase